MRYALALAVPGFLFVWWMLRAWRADRQPLATTRLDAFRQIEQAEVIRRRAALAAVAEWPQKAS